MINRARQHILIIDDDKSDRDWIMEHLRKDGYSVLGVADGQSGVEKTLKLKPDLVILDLFMPGLSGKDVLFELSKKKPELPIVIIARRGTTDDILQSLHLGAWDFWFKPIDDFKLFELCIDRVLDRNALLNKHKEQATQLEHCIVQLENSVDEKNQSLEETVQYLEQVNRDQKKQTRQLAQAVCNIIDAAPNIQQGHSRVVAEKSVIVAREMALDEELIEQIMFAGLMIQLGKIALPNKLLKKRFYQLSQDERLEYFQHAIEGEKLINGFSAFEEASMIIRSQYEKYNGSGFPDGLSGEEIPIGARIVKVLQDFINFQKGETTGAPMKSLQEILEKMNRFKGSEYDPKILTLFTRFVLGQMHHTSKIVINSTCEKLREGMFIDTVEYKNITYVKNQIASPDLIKKIKEYRYRFGPNIVIKVQLD